MSPTRTCFLITCCDDEDVVGLFSVAVFLHISFLASEASPVFFHRHNGAQTASPCAVNCPKSFRAEIGADLLTSSCSRSSCRLGVKIPILTSLHRGVLVTGSYPPSRPSPTSHTCPSSHQCRHLAHVYAAEALCVLGRPNEALEHLSPLSEDTSTIAAAAAAGVWASNRKPGAGASPPGATTVPASAGGAVTSRKAGAGAAAARRVGENSGGAIGVAGDLSLEAAAEARASLHTNLAAVHSLQDNLALAERCARTAMGICPGSASVLRMAVYVLIRQGNVEEALQVMKETGAVSSVFSLQSLA